MSLFASLTTAISGLRAQSRSLGHISDNVANSQTAGFKRIDTNFVSYVTQSSASSHAPGTVIARPDYTNTVQGTIEQADGPLSIAVRGQGFFSVGLPLGTENGEPVFDDRQFYSRAGDFRMDKNGYIQNGAGYYLQGWPMDPVTGNPDRTVVSPVRIDQQVFNPIATSEIEFSANLPADATTDPINTQAQVYDQLGRRQVVNLTFTPVPPTAPSTIPTSEWTVSVDVPNDINAPARGGAVVEFGGAATPAAAPGTLGSFRAPTGSVTVSAAVPGEAAQLTFNADFGQGTQSVVLDLGQFGVAGGLTQYSGTEFSVRNLAQNGVPLGGYAGVALQENGDVAINYDNGQSRIVARVPLVAFNDPDKLQRLDGQAFLRTQASGEARVTDVGSDGVGKLVTGAIERSNVDIADEFTKLIVAQRAYTANTRIVTTSDELLGETINMKR